MPSDNYILVVEAFKPPKDLALAYLADETMTFAKYAHVCPRSCDGSSKSVDGQAVIGQGADEEAITDYLIGPLPISDKTTFRPLKELYHHPIPLNAKMFFNWTTLKETTERLMKPLDEVTMDLFNGSVIDGTLMAASHAPSSYDGT